MKINTQNKLNNLVGILDSCDEIEIVSLNKEIKSCLEESEIYKYKGVNMYMWEDVVYCVGNDKKEIENQLVKFNKDPKVKEYFNMD